MKADVNAQQHWWHAVAHHTHDHLSQPVSLSQEFVRTQNVYIDSEALNVQEVLMPGMYHGENVDPPMALIDGPVYASIGAGHFETAWPAPESTVYSEL
jgi:hypothetical protein